MLRSTQWTAATLLGLMLGCDKPPPPPPQVEDATAETEESTDEIPSDRRPESSELMAGAWRSIPLGIYPLRIQVPEKWDVVKGGTSTFLRGPTPSGPLPEGEVNISVSKPPFPKEVAKGLVEDMKKRAASQPASPPTTGPSLAHVAVRELGPARIVDQRTVEPARGGLPEMMRWTVLVVVPADANTINSYQLSFLDLAAEQYRKDKELLEKIIGSLEVDLSAGFTPVPTTPQTDPFK